MLSGHIMSACQVFLACILLAYAPLSLSRGMRTLGEPKRGPKKATVNGVAFSIPKGYVAIPQTKTENSLFLFYRKYSEGIIVAVPGSLFDEATLLNSLTEAGLSTFFPEKSNNLQWKRLADYKKFSKFEIGGAQAMGYNKKDLFIVHSHHFRAHEKDIFIIDLFKWDNGGAADMFLGGLGGESMQGCNDMVEIIYSITGEKIDDTNSPCELIAVSPLN
jgi:hypothetical protein